MLRRRRCYGGADAEEAQMRRRSRCGGGEDAEEPASYGGQRRHGGVWRRGACPCYGEPIGAGTRGYTRGGDQWEEGQEDISAERTPAMAPHTTRSRSGSELVPSQCCPS
eukprot:2507203-Pyramimonas_sp.AAC.2